MSLARDLAFSVPPDLQRRGARVWAEGSVSIIEGSAERVSAEVEGSRTYEVALTREEDKIFAYCDCPYFDSSGPCKHVWAVMLAADSNGWLQGRSGRRAKGLFTDADDEDDDSLFDLAAPTFQQARNSASRVPPPPQWQSLIQQIPSGTMRSVETWRADRELY